MTAFCTWARFWPMRVLLSQGEPGQCQGGRIGNCLGGRIGCFFCHGLERIELLGIDRGERPVAFGEKDLQFGSAALNCPLRPSVIFFRSAASALSPAGSRVRAASLTRCRNSQGESESRAAGAIFRASFTNLASSILSRDRLLAAIMAATPMHAAKRSCTAPFSVSLNAWSNSPFCGLATLGTAATRRYGSSKSAPSQGVPGLFLWSLSSPRCTIKADFLARWWERYRRRAG